jgi:hypothetical protein
MSTKSIKSIKFVGLHRIALGAALVAVAAILVSPAAAKPTPASAEGAVITLGPGEIPEVASIRVGPGEIPYVEYGAPASTSPVGNDGSELGLGIVGTSVVFLLLAGSLVAIRHSRRAKLSPA